MTDPTDAPAQAAVIDVGSNSVRMVLYRLEGRAIWTVFNEKVLAAGARLLGRIFWKVGDVAIIDGLIVNGSAKVVGLIGSLTRLFQTGYLYHYALVMILGVFALMTWFVFMQH